MTESIPTVQKCRNLGIWYFSIVKTSQRFSVVQNCQNPAGTPNLNSKVIYMFKRKESIHWIEVNVKIVKSVLSSNSWGTEVAHAQNKSQRRVRITVEIPLKEKRVVMATKKY